MALNPNRRLRSGDLLGRGEKVGAFVWLSLFALVLASFSVVLWPLSLVLVPAGHWVLARTAALWTPHRVLWLIPLLVWLGCALLFSGGNYIRVILLLVASMLGVLWVMLKRQVAFCI